MVGLQPVVELHLGAFDHLVDHALHVGAGASCLALVSRCMVFKSARSASSAPGYWIFTATSRPSAHRPVHLADAGRATGSSLKRAEPDRPLWCPTGRRASGGLFRPAAAARVFLQLGQRLAVGPAVLLGDGGLQHRGAWPAFIAPPLSSPSTLNSWLAAFHQLGVDFVAGFPRSAACPAPARPDQPYRPGCWPASRCSDTSTLDVVGHASIIPDPG